MAMAGRSLSPDRLRTSALFSNLAALEEEWKQVQGRPVSRARSRQGTPSRNRELSPPAQASGAHGSLLDAPAACALQARSSDIPVAASPKQGHSRDNSGPGSGPAANIAQEKHQARKEPTSSAGGSQPSKPKPTPAQQQKAQQQQQQQQAKKVRPKRKPSVVPSKPEGGARASYEGSPGQPPVKAASLPMPAMQNSNNNQAGALKPEPTSAGKPVRKKWTPPPWNAGIGDMDPTHATEPESAAAVTAGTDCPRTSSSGAASGDAHAQPGDGSRGSQGGQAQRGRWAGQPGEARVGSSSLKGAAQAQPAGRVHLSHSKSGIPSVSALQLSTPHQPPAISSAGSHIPAPPLVSHRSLSSSFSDTNHPQPTQPRTQEVTLSQDGPAREEPLPAVQHSDQLSLRPHPPLRPSPCVSGAGFRRRSSTNGASQPTSPCATPPRSVSPDAPTTNHQTEPTVAPLSDKQAARTSASGTPRQRSKPVSSHASSNAGTPSQSRPHSGAALPPLSDTPPPPLPPPTAVPPQESSGGSIAKLKDPVYMRKLSALRRAPPSAPTSDQLPVQQQRARAAASASSIPEELTSDQQPAPAGTPASRASAHARQPQQRQSDSGLSDIVGLLSGSSLGLPSPGGESASGLLSDSVVGTPGQPWGAGARDRPVSQGRRAASPLRGGGMSQEWSCRLASPVVVSREEGGSRPGTSGAGAGAAAAEGQSQLLVVDQARSAHTSAQGVWDGHGGRQPTQPAQPPQPPLPGDPAAQVPQPNHPPRQRGRWHQPPTDQQPPVVVQQGPPEPHSPWSPDGPTHEPHSPPHEHVPPQGYAYQPQHPPFLQHPPPPPQQQPLQQWQPQRPPMQHSTPTFVHHPPGTLPHAGLYPPPPPPPPWATDHPPLPATGSFSPHDSFGPHGMQGSFGPPSWAMQSVALPPPYMHDSGYMQGSGHLQGPPYMHGAGHMGHMPQPAQGPPPPWEQGAQGMDVRYMEPAHHSPSHVMAAHAPPGGVMFAAGGPWGPPPPPVAPSRMHLDVPDYMRMSMSKYTTGWAANPMQAAPGPLSAFADIYRHRHPPPPPPPMPLPTHHEADMAMQQHWQQGGVRRPPQESLHERRQAAQAAFEGMSLAEVLASAPKKEPPPFRKAKGPMAGPAASRSEDA